MTDVDGTAGFGVRRLPAGLPDQLRAALIAEAEARTFAPPHPRAGGWFAKIDLPAAPETSRAVEFLVALAARSGLRFSPNEASFQRYEPGGNGLPAHRDQRYYVGCIAIVTLLGEATFALLTGRGPDQVVTEWTTGPGEVVLLPGWHRGDTDPRPWHRVDPPTTGPRMMFQLRRLAIPDTPDWSSVYSRTEHDQAVDLAARRACPRGGF